MKEHEQQTSRLGSMSDFFSGSNFSRYSYNLYKYFMDKISISRFAVRLWLVLVMTTLSVEGVSSPDGEGLELRETFSSCGYYWSPKKTAVPKTPLNVEFREAGRSQWRRTLAPAWFEADKMFRGSIVGLRESACYELRLLDAADNVVVSGKFTTWSSNVPVAKTVDISSRVKNGTIVISDKGRPDGWIRFIAPKGFSVAGDASTELAGIEVRDAEYVLFDGITVKGGKRHGIQVSGSRFVRIANCDISGWGRDGEMEFMPRAYFHKRRELINCDAGVSARDSIGLVVERCFIHDPRSPSTSWTYGHPVGADAMYVYRLQQTVVRYNDMIGTDERRWNDVIESGGNFSKDGGFYRDADIYGNYLAFPNDDGIELDGGQMNVRFFENKVEGGYCGISTISCVLGPSYVFRNLIVNLGDCDGNNNVILKDHLSYGNIGMVYYVNNTLYSDGIGMASMPKRRFGRNNVLCTGESPVGAKIDPKTIDFNYDLLWSLKGRQIKPENIGTHSIEKEPQFVDAAKGLWALRIDSQGADSGAVVSDFGLVDSGGKGVIGAFIPGSLTTGPVRPAAFVADHGQILFGTVKEGEQVTETTVNVKVDGSYTGILQIRKNDSFDWFRVEPEKVAVKPGDSVTFTVTLNPDKMRRSGLFSGAFIIRDADGLSRPVAVYARRSGQTQVAKFPDNAVMIPAAKAMNGNAPVVSEKGSIEATVVSVKPGKDTGVLSWAFNLPESGDYYILLHCKAWDPKMHHNEVDFSLDGSAFQHLRLQLLSDRWVWAGVRNPERKSRIWLNSQMGWFQLKAGEHRIELKPREQFYLDRIVITPDFRLDHFNALNFYKFTPVNMP